MEVVTLISAGFVATSFVAGWFIGQSIRYKKKFKDLNGNYGKLKQDLTKALGEVGRSKLTIESLQASNADLVEHIKEYKHLITSGCRNLKVKVGDGPIVLNDRPVGTVAVVGMNTRNSKSCFFIKTFTYDYYDPSDREFAIREAEELIETIQKF